MLWEHIKEKMLRHPESKIEEENRSYTFAEIVAAAEETAAKLKPGRYAVCCLSEMNAGIAILACLAAGVTAIPLSTRYGQIHCDRILELTKPNFFFSDAAGGLEVRAETGAPDFDENDACALIMCTSGTTGIPKGAMITEENLFANLSDIDAYFDLRCEDRILIARPLYHCAVLSGEFLISLIKGANIRFQSEAFDPVQLAGRLADGITVFCGTPTLLTRLARVAGRVAERYPLRMMVSSGECMTADSAARIRKAFPYVRIMNVYGLTEASPRVAYLPPELFDCHAETVGYPLRSLEVRIADSDGNALPYDTDGELLVRGPSVMRGYYRAPEATRRALAGGWLHTGDIASMDSEGRIRVKCRRDNMIILAGINIYPQEIENALSEEPRISGVLAYGACDADGRKHIAVKIVASGLTKADAVRICRERLPAYEQPTVFEFVDALPRNASGKLLRPKGEVKL